MAVQRITIQKPFMNFTSVPETEIQLIEMTARYQTLN